MVLEFLKQVLDVLVNGRLVDDVAVDTRPEFEKSKDYIYGQDIQLPGAAVSKRIKKLPIVPYDQQRTSACGAYSAAHARKLEDGMETYPPLWYRTRTNYPGLGMYIKDVLELIAYAVRTEYNGLAPDILTEEFVNLLPKKDVLAKDRNREYFTIKPFDVDGVFEAVSAGHPTLVTFFCTDNEWDFEMIPKDTVFASTARVRHYVVAIPNSVHSNGGHEWVSVVDSSPNKGHSLRHIRKDFLEKRMYLGGGFVKERKVVDAPTLEFPTWRCEYGQKNNAVLVLQKYLVSQGLLSPEHTTSYYGNITANAVLRWQMENRVGISMSDLEELRGWYWGPLSISAVKNKHNV